MGRYDPLTTFLADQAEDVVRVAFDDVERIVGRKLPPSATTHRAFWSNNPSNNVMTQAWLAAGFQSENVDLVGRKVVFRRMKEKTMPGFAEAQAPFAFKEAVPDKLALFGWMQGTITVAPGVDLTEPTDPEWADLVDERDEPAS